MSAFWQLARLLFKRRGMVIAAVVMAFVSAAGLGVGLLSLGPVLEQILHPDSGSGLHALALQHNASGAAVQVPEWLVHRLPTDRFDGVVLLIIFIWCLTVLGATANFLHQYLSQTLTTITIADIRRRLFVHVLGLPLSRVVAQGPSEYVSRVIRDAAALESGFIGLLGKSVAQITKGIAALIVAIIFDWTIVVAALVVGPILAIVLRKLAKRIRRGSHGSLVAQQDLLRQSNEGLTGLRSVKAACAESQAADAFDESNAEVVRHELKMRTARALSSPIMETLAIVVLGALAMVAAKSILKGELPFDRFLLSIGSLAVAGASFRPLAGVINQIAAAAAPARRILDVLDEAPETAGERALGRHERSIQFDNVAFTYPGASEPAIRDVSFEVAFGEHVAVVGPNGSGKTTLLSLLPRLIEPTSGRVLVDDVDLAEVTLASLRQQIGVVAQEPWVVRDTIAGNIAVGVPGATREDIIAAARHARANAFIEAMPEGYDSVVSEHGASLSGGQRQRLSIARALLRQPAMLVLDEATSQVDSESEAAIAEAIRGIKGRTVLVIAHRLATVVDCDRIVVMDEGRVVDTGTHAQLLARCPLYERLIRTQLVAAES